MTPHSPGTGQINTLIWIGFFAALIVVVAINLGLLDAVGRFRGERGRTASHAKGDRGVRLEVVGALSGFAILLFLLQINTLIWIDFLAALIVVVAINLGLRFRGGRGRTASPTKGDRGVQLRVVGALSGFAVLLFVLGVIFTSNATSTPKTTSAGLTSLKSEPLVIKATGQQWLWRYNYPNGSFSYWKLVIPVDTAIEMRLESTDVVHTWSVPDLAPKTDAVPGKNTEVVFRADAEGEFYGQSSTLSGQAYAPMRTTVEVVSPERYEEFIVEQQKGIKEGQKSAEELESRKLEEEPSTEGEEPSAKSEESAMEGEE